MGKKPLVYIIILNFNSFDETLRCIDSVRDVEYENYKVVVIDNNSQDGSVDILKKRAGDFILIENSDNLGYARGNNVGIQYGISNGAEYICVLNNDVEVKKDFLNIIIDYMEKNRKVGICGPCICDFENRTKIQSMGANINLFTGLAMAKKKNKPYESVNGKTYEVDYLGGACFVARKEVFDNIGFIPELYFLFYEETEFCLTAKRAGYKLICLKDSLIYHKRSATISKYKGLSYYFLNRNRIIFMRRNAAIHHKVIFSLYLLLEAMGRITLRREPLNLFKIYSEGLKADINNPDLSKVSGFLKQ
ncbi:MAG: glycosyltransferase family 2 protein [Bacillota bacterium]|nr:glycosyltransferase family 2 protein [Bacillota bacterium]